MTEARFEDIRAGDLVRVTLTRDGISPIRIVLEAEAGELIWPEDGTNIHWTTRIGSVLVYKEEWFVEQKIEILEERVQLQKPPTD